MKIQSDKTTFGREGIFRRDAGPHGTFVEMPYSGIRSFLRRPVSSQFEGVDMVVYGVPVDMMTSGRSGARHGPAALREASSQLAWGEVWPWGFDPFDTLSVVDAGDVPFRRGQAPLMFENAIQFCRGIVGCGASTLMLGGDHSVTYTALKAHAEKHGPLALVQFDAHRDTQSSDYLDHGTFVHHAMKEGLIDPHRSIQIGIRTYYDNRDDITVLYRDWLHDHSRQDMISRIREVTGGAPVYLSVDIDGFDPSYAPGTGTPVVDGLAPIDVIAFLRSSVDLNFVGLDVVEVAPSYDPAGSTALLGASVALEFVCARAAQRLQVAP